MTPHATNHIMKSASIGASIDALKDAKLLSVEGGAERAAHDSGLVIDTWSGDEVDLETEDDTVFELAPQFKKQFKQLNDNLQKREEILKLDRQRNLLNTQLQHLKK